MDLTLFPIIRAVYGLCDHDANNMEDDILYIASIQVFSFFL